MLLNANIEERNKLIESIKRELKGEQKRKELKLEERKLNAVNNDLREWESYVRSADAKIIRLEAKKHQILMNCLVFIE